MAVAALVFGILPMFGGLLGIGLGIGALARIRRSGRAGRGMAIAGIVLGALWLVVLVAATAVAFVVGHDVHRDSTGAPTSSGPVTLKDVRAGDCASTLPLGTHVVTVDVLPCDEPHLGEVYLTFDFAPGTYPGEPEVRRLTSGRCQAALPEYVGATPGATGYNIVFVKPSATSWSHGTRHVVCMLVRPSHERMTGSAKGAGPLDGG
jgi:hypothetical protein